MHPRSPRTTPVIAAIINAAIVALLVAAGAVAASPAQAADGTDVTWGVRTAPTEQGANRDNYNYSVDPGTVINDALVISNHDVTPLDLDLYGADGFTTTSGNLDVVTKKTKSVALGSWVTFATGHIQIPAGESVTTPFVVTVPENATPGDYAGGVISSLLQPDAQQGITVDRRLGIRIHLRVSGALAPGAAIENMKVDYAGTLNPFGTGAATVSYTVHNTGNTRLAAGQTVSLAGPFGLFAVDAAKVAPVPELLPGESWKVSVAVTGVVPAFWLSADATLTPKVAGDIGTVTDPAPIENTATTWAVPWALLVIVVLLALLVVGAVILARRRGRARAALEAVRIEEAVQIALGERAAQEAVGAKEPADETKAVEATEPTDEPKAVEATEPADTTEPADEPKSVDA